MSVTRVGLRRRATIAASGVSWLETDWDDACDDAISALWRLITSKNRDFRVKSTTISITDVTAPFGTLPSDFMDVRTVCRNAGTQSESFLSKVGPKTGSMGFERGHRLEDSSPTKLVIEPYESSIGTYLVKYTPQPPLLTADTGTGGTLDVELQQFAEYLVAHMAVAALGSDESSTTAQQVKLDKAEAAVISWASNQRDADPDQVEDVRGRRRGVILP